jgi:uncharacterized protein (UPF0332 family)
MENNARLFLAKALESLASVEADLAAGHYNGCASRCYYACFQAAIAALLAADITPTGIWGHDFVRARFAGILINRRHLYPSDLKNVLPELSFLRQRADYEPEHMSRTQAERALRRTTAFVAAVRERS